MNHEQASGRDQPAGKGGRIWSWVSTTEDRDERSAHARRLVGLEMAVVRYFDIDYSRDLVPEHRGPRHISTAQEWLHPAWRSHDCDSIDFGVELETTDGRIFSVTWDPPGDREGLGIHEQPLLGSALALDADAAVWNVTHHGQWPSLVRRPVDDVTMHYEDWGPSGAGFWCRRISMRVSTGQVDFLLAEGHTDRPMTPSADNVAVVFAAGGHPAAPRHG